MNTDSPLPPLRPPLRPLALAYAPPEPRRGAIVRFLNEDILRWFSVVIALIGIAILLAAAVTRVGAFAGLGFLWLITGGLVHSISVLATVIGLFTDLWLKHPSERSARRRGVTFVLQVVIYLIAYGCVMVGERMVTSGWIR